MTSLSELLAKKAELEKRIDDARRAERGAAIAKVKALMAQYGLSPADIGRPVRAPAAKGASSVAPAPEAARKRKALGKVAPKFRDPATGSTWAGRGRKPLWLSAALAAGGTLDEFRL